MTTRGKYNAIFNYRAGKRKGYLEAQREFANVLPQIVDRHVKAMNEEFVDWKMASIHITSKERWGIPHDRN